MVAPWGHTWNIFENNQPVNDWWHPINNLGPPAILWRPSVHNSRPLIIIWKPPDIKAPVTPERFCNRTIVGDFIRQRLVARIFYDRGYSRRLRLFCGGRTTDRTTRHAIVWNLKISIARSVVGNLITCCCDLRLIVRLVVETNDWSNEQL